MGVWLFTVQSAPTPQEPGHGSLHFSFIHALLLGHSALITHSGLQLGGLPTYWGKQEHDGYPPWSWHVENNPQGFGIHGFNGSGGVCCIGGPAKSNHV